MFKLMLQSLFVFLPAAIANMMPVLVKDIRFLRIPIDFGIKIKGKEIFGQNKTWRGFFFGIIGSIVVVYAIAYAGPKDYLVLDYSQINLVLFGALLGAGALLGDLIESFAKRRLGIAPGKPLWIFDQIDWILGAVIAFALMTNSFDFVLMVFSVVFFGLLHPLINYVGYLLKIKENKF